MTNTSDCHNRRETIAALVTRLSIESKPVRVAEPTPSPVVKSDPKPVIQSEPILVAGDPFVATQIDPIRLETRQLAAGGVLCRITEVAGSANAKLGLIFQDKTRLGRLRLEAIGLFQIADWV